MIKIFGFLEPFIAQQAPLFVSQINDLVQNQKISDDIFTALKNRLYAQQIRVFDRFEGLAIELFQSKIQGISLTEQLDLIASLDAESTFHAVSRLDLSSQSHIVIKGYDQS